MNLTFTDAKEKRPPYGGGLLVPRPILRLRIPQWFAFGLPDPDAPGFMWVSGKNQETVEVDQWALLPR